MSDYPPNRRSNDTPLGDTARILAITYTVGFFVVLLLIIGGFAKSSEATTQQILSILSIIQTAITAFYYGFSKSGEATSRALATQKAASDAMILDTLAKNVGQQSDPK